MGTPDMSPNGLQAMSENPSMTSALPSLSHLTSCPTSLGLGLPFNQLPLMSSENVLAPVPGLEYTDMYLNQNLNMANMIPGGTLPGDNIESMNIANDNVNGGTWYTG